MSFGTVRLRRLSQAQVAKIKDLLPDGDKELEPEEVMALGVEIVALTAIDAQGNRIFDSKEGRHLLAQVSINDANQLTEAAMDLNGFTGEETVKKK